MASLLITALQQPAASACTLLGAVALALGCGQTTDDSPTGLDGNQTLGSGGQPVEVAKGGTMGLASGGNAASAGGSTSDSSLQCEPGFGDCNEDQSDGCESSIMDSLEHCGFCGQHCTLEACIEGMCLDPERNLAVHSPIFVGLDAGLLYVLQGVSGSQLTVLQPIDGAWEIARVISIGSGAYPYGSFLDGVISESKLYLLLIDGCGELMSCNNWTLAVDLESGKVEELQGSLPGEPNVKLRRKLAARSGELLIAQPGQLSVVEGPENSRLLSELPNKQVYDLIADKEYVFMAGEVGVVRVVQDGQLESVWDDGAALMMAQSETHVFWTDDTDIWRRDKELATAAERIATTASPPNALYRWGDWLYVSEAGTREIGVVPALPSLITRLSLTGGQPQELASREADYYGASLLLATDTQVLFTETVSFPGELIATVSLPENE